MQNDINILKGKKTPVKTPNNKNETLLQQMKKQFTQLQDDIKSSKLLL